ncbi:MAG: hypothetical protein IH623_02210 [Verrucomicrobia bacterium]|nr:hypothetical protein [Verrucomicrobiota bacterium]
MTEDPWQNGRRQKRGILRGGGYTLFTMALLGGMPASSQAQTNFSDLLVNGPVSNRVNIVFLAEGYRTNEYASFLAHATNALNILLAGQPFAEYQSYFNAYAIAVPSAQSGSDHPVNGVTGFRDTYFNSTYGYSDYLISIPPNEFDLNYSNGQGRVAALLATFMPECDLAVMLVNDHTVGGSDGGGGIALSSISPNSLSDFVVHETGHVLAGLGDEYTLAYPGFPDTEEPNTTRETNRASIKWNAWIAAETPVPTPATGEYADRVGLFEGAHYHETGWYRPKLNCRMGNNGIGFCEVCSEALVLSFYREVRPVESRLPASGNLLVTTGGALEFSLAMVQPSSHALSIQWLTNGTPVPDATGNTFRVLPELLSNGLNTITAQVVDPTPLVRTDPTNVLAQTVGWAVDVDLPYLQLDEPRWLDGGRFTFRVSGVAPEGFLIQASSNFTVWTPLLTNSLVNGQFQYTNLNSGQFASRFFRAVVLP